MLPARGRATCPRFPHSWVHRPVGIGLNGPLLDPRRHHVHRVTVIPAEPPLSAEDVEKKFAREIAQKATSDLARQREIANALATATDIDEMSKSDIVEAARTLQWLYEHSRSEVQEFELEPYWNVLSNIRVDQVRGLLPHEVATIATSMAMCEKRLPDLTRALSEHSRRLVKHFSPIDMAQIVRAYGHMSWRSKKTIQVFGQRIVHMVRSSDLAPSVSGRHLRSIVAAHARLGIRWDHSKKHEARDLDMWKAIAVAVPSRFGDMSSRDYAAILNAYAKMNFMFSPIRRNVMHLFETSVPPLIREIAGEADEEVKRFLPRELALVCNAYARINAGSFVQPLFRAIAQNAVTQMHVCNHQDVANIVNGFAKLSVPDNPLFEAAALAVAPNVVNYSPQALSNVAHAYARQQVRHAEMLDSVAEMSCRVMDKFTPQSLGNLAYAYGKLQVRHAGLLRGLQDEVIYRGTIGKSLQDSSNLYRFSLRSTQLLTQGFSRLGVQDQRLYFVLFDMVRQRVRDFVQRTERQIEEEELEETTKKNTRQKKNKKGQIAQTPEDLRAAQLAAWGEEPRMLDGHSLSVLLSAFANGRADFMSLVRWVPKEVIRLQGQYTTWQLGTMFNACTRLGVVDKPMYKDMLVHAKLRMPQMSPKVVAMLVRGMARAKMFNRAVMRQAVKAVSPKLADVDVVDAGALLVGCAEMGFRDERFLRLLAAVVKARAQEMSVSQLAQAFASYSQMRIKHGKWYNSILFELFNRQHEMAEKDATNVAYAMMLINAMERFDINAHAAEEREHGEAPSPSSEGPLYPFNKHTGVLFALLGITDKGRKTVNYPSVFQMQIIELYLRLLSPTVYEEMPHALKQLLAKARRVNVVVDDYMQNSSKMHRRVSKWFTRVGLHHRSEVFFGPFMLDIVIGDKVVVEVDGPSHFYRDTNSRTTTSIMKDMLLTKAGFHVKHLPYQEWLQCGTAEKRLLYCASFWQEVLAVQTATGDAPRLPPLVDVVDMVLESQVRLLDDGTAQGNQEQQQQQQQGPDAMSEPAFYTDDREGPRVERRRGGPTPSDVDAESIGTRSVEELLVAHRESEKQLARDRRRGLSAKDRWREEHRNAQKISAVDEWQQTYISSNRKQDSPPESFYDRAVMAQLREVLPRERRTLPAKHLGGPATRGQLEAMEDTDDSDDEAVPSRSSSSIGQRRRPV